MIDLKWLQWLERQFGASLDMLETALNSATEEVWDNETDTPKFWSISYHVLFYVDFYLSTFRSDLNNPAEE